MPLAKAQRRAPVSDWMAAPSSCKPTAPDHRPHIWDLLGLVGAVRFLRNGGGQGRCIGRQRLRPNLKHGAPGLSEPLGEGFKIDEMLQPLWMTSTATSSGNDGK
jgi:hypothetical protein